MVKTQIERRGVRDPAVLAAMRNVRRHRFVPEDLCFEAYNDYPLSIGYGQTISQPYIVAYMTELLRVGAGDKVLEIGTGSGYQTAVLAELRCEVFSVEVVEVLACSSRALLEKLGYANVHVEYADGYEGWPDNAPYDAIIVTAAPLSVPNALVEQLKENGRLVVPIGKDTQDLCVIEKTPTGPKKRSIIPVRFVPMTNGTMK